MDKGFKILSNFNPDLVSAIESHSMVKTIPKDFEILRQGQYVGAIPLVLKGLIKVFTRYEDKELLLYYIKPNESCVMSFAASLKNEPSRIFAITEEQTEVLLLPVNKVPDWIKQYPGLNTLFFEQYNLRYSELLDTINHLLFDKLDTRLLKYLREKSSLIYSEVLSLSHREIANELGTAREVVSRLLKKLESEGFIKQTEQGIKIISSGD